MPGQLFTSVQKNVATTASALSATMPAWGSTTTKGNLLVIYAMNRGTNVAITANPSGYSASGNTPSFWNSGQSFIYYKIAAGGEATPTTITRSGTLTSWTVYTYEYSAEPYGWLPVAVVLDKETLSTTGAGSVTSRTVAASGTSVEQSGALAVCETHSQGLTPSSYTNGYVADEPAGVQTNLRVAQVVSTGNTSPGTVVTWVSGGVVAAARVVMWRPASPNFLRQVAARGAHPIYSGA